MSYTYLPNAPVVLASVTASTAFTAVNASFGTKTYCFVATQDCYIKRGQSGIGAATSADFLLRAGTHLFALARGEGVRVIRVTADGILQIGDVGV